MSDKDGDFVPLCPAFFLKDNPACGLPEADTVDSNVLRKHAHHCQLLREGLRSRFRKDYLGQLKHHAHNKEITVKPGDVVIVEVDDKKRTDWPLGLVKEVYPGRDSKVHKALLKTKMGEFLRPIQRLFILEAAVVREDSKEEDKTSHDAPELQDGSRRRSGRKVIQPDRLNYK